MRRLALIVVLVLVGAGGAHAATDGKMNFYVAAEGGYAWVENSSGGVVGEDNWFPWVNTGSDRDNGGSVGIKLGMSLGERFRVDLGYAYYGESDFITESEPTPSGGFSWHSEAEIHTLMLAAYYDYATLEKATFYIGAGLGASFIDFDAFEYSPSGAPTALYASDSDTLFAWQVETGVEYLISERFVLYGGVRYADLGEIDSVVNWGILGPDGNLEADFDVWDLFVGLRYSF